MSLDYVPVFQWVRQWVRIFERKSFGTVGLRMLEELVGRALFENLAVRHEDDAVGGLRAKPISWVTQIIVMPSCASSTITSSTSLTISGSSAEVGSSNSMTLGRMAARAGDGHTLLLAAGELGGHLAGLGVDAHAGEQVHGQLLGFPSCPCDAP